MPGRRHFTAARLKQPGANLANFAAQRNDVALSRREAEKLAREQAARARDHAEKKLINAESLLGRTVFGRIAPGYHREFFCLKKNVWIWYENGVTMRYEVRENGVFKKVNTGEYICIEGEELNNFRAATKAYLELVKTHLYR